MKTNYKIIISVLVAIAIIFFLSSGNKTSPQSPQSPQKLAGFIGASNATTTDTTWNKVSITTQFKVLKVGSGVLNNVVITGATTATELKFYDATTTNSHLNHATTSIGITNISTPAGTYEFNTSFTRGLIVEFPSALGAASSTITWE